MATITQKLTFLERRFSQPQLAEAVGTSPRYLRLIKSHARKGKKYTDLINKIYEDTKTLKKVEPAKATSKARKLENIKQYNWSDPDIEIFAPEISKWKKIKKSISAYDEILTFTFYIKPIIGDDMIKIKKLFNRLIDYGRHIHEFYEIINFKLISNQGYKKRFTTFESLYIKKTEFLTLKNETIIDFFMPYGNENKYFKSCGVSMANDIIIAVITLRK